MKLRIFGDSLRFRVSQSEFAHLVSNGFVSSSVQLGPGENDRLVYALKRVADKLNVSVDASPGHITVLIPAQQLERWQRPDAVGLRATQDVGGRKTLSILVEKDFACIDGASEEENRDTFPNPRAQTTRC